MQEENGLRDPEILMQEENGLRDPEILMQEENGFQSFTVSLIDLMLSFSILPLYFIYFHLCIV
jgi:hypothetical protein